MREQNALLRQNPSDSSSPPALAELFGPSPDAAQPSHQLCRLLAEIYGDNLHTLKRHLDRLDRLCTKFLELYGDGPVQLLRAPARINILGEHVDYVSYLPTYSLPFGSREHDMLMLYSAAAAERVRGASTHADYAPFDFSLDECRAGDNAQDYENEWLNFLYNAAPPAAHWGSYVKGSCFFARFKFDTQAVRGFDFIVDSSIPPKGGASSSSALVVLAGAAVRKVNNLAFVPGELAIDSSKAEWFIGTRGGSMDHLTICLARRSHAVLIAYRGRSTRLLPLPSARLVWATFFSHPADKGREIMLEYNERAAVSRLLIPAIIDGWKHSDPQRHTAWSNAVEALVLGAARASEEIESLLAELPETITLGEIERDYPETYRQCENAFPALVSERRERPLRVRAYAFHHLGEIRRVAAAEEILNPSPDKSVAIENDDPDTALRLGALLKESHASLRDLYGVSTPEVEKLIEIILSDFQVFGARLMGGGFGGNILALTTEENLAALVERVKAEYYAPRGRDAAREGSLMISTPGDGLAQLNLDSVWRASVKEFCARGREAASERSRIVEILDNVETDAEAREVWPVIVAAGKGSRARESGLDVPKPVAPIGGVPAILRVFRSIRAGCDGARPPVVIVSPETEAQVREALRGEEAHFVLQPEARGTGDALWQAHALMKNFNGRALVVWSTQPVIRERTIRRALKLASLFDEYEVVLPTALKENPYAPVERDESGRILASRETHLEAASRPDFGETNIGLFVLNNRSMFDALLDLRKRFWRESDGRYERRGGELGFPNEMINYFAARETGVLACPFADGREEQGIKTLADLARCERFIAELKDAE